MNHSVDEATAITNTVLTALQQTVPGPQTTASAQLAFLCGQLSAGAPSLLDIPANQIGDLAAYFTELQACFDQATTAGATYETMNAIVVLVPTLNPKYNLGAAVSNFVMRMALAEQANILAAFTFTNREQIDNYLNEIVASFGPAIEVAADNMDQLVYQSLIALQSAVVNDLSIRAIPLPQIVTVTYPVALPALTIAQRLYQDPTQVATLVAMNDIPAPLFCPRSLQVLSVGPAQP
jgi:hypothetical protein